jgi:hypothetical protein
MSYRNPFEKLLVEEAIPVGVPFSYQEALELRSQDNAREDSSWTQWADASN